MRARAALAVAVAVTCLLAGAVGPAGADTSVSATLGSASDEFSLVLTPVQVPTGGVVLVATNGGAEEHTLGLKGGPATAEILPGGTETLDVGNLEAGTYTFVCTIAGHEQLGMTANLTVAGAGSTSTTAPATNTTALTNTTVAGTNTTIAGNTTATTVAQSAGTDDDETATTGTVPATRRLPETGSEVWVELLGALIVLNAGYLLWSATQPGRRRRRGRVSG